VPWVSGYALLTEVAWGCTICFNLRDVHFVLA
jgi:hypothetical protein